MSFSIKEILAGLGSGDPLSWFLVTLLLIFNEVGLPLPIVYESILLYAGYGLAQNNPGYLAVAAFGSLGSGLGASLLFFLFFLLGSPILKSKFFKNHAGKIKALKRELLKREILTVALGRLTPGLLSLTSLTAGILRLNYFKFILGVLLSNLVWAFILITAGFVVGRLYPSGSSLEGATQKVSLILGLTALGLFLFLFKRIVSKVKNGSGLEEEKSKNF